MSITAPSSSFFLITLSGQDRSGITSEITQTLADHSAKLVDISQAVIQKLLSLSILFQLDPKGDSEKTVLKELQLQADRLKLQLNFQQLSPQMLLSYTTAAKRSEKDKTTLWHYAVTLIADEISAQAFHKVAQVLARWNVNIDTIKRLSDGEFGCVEMGVSSTEPLDARKLRQEILTLAKEQGVDIALQAEGLFRRAKRLVVLDMDSTLIQSEVIDELAREKGVFSEVSEITHRAMQGEIDYNESLVQRCEKLKGLTLADLERVYQRIEITLGAEDLIFVLKKLGYKIAVISGGFSFIAERLKEKLGIHFAYSNTLEVKDKALTGRVLLPIVNAARKADLLEVIAQQEKIDLDQVIAIGDGANDLLMLEKAGLGIAFNAKPMVRESADMALSQKNLRSILYLLGLSASEIHEALPRTDRV